MIITLYCVLYSLTDVALGRMIPCMVGDRVMEGDENWENYLLLLRIVDYLFAPAISYEETVYLKVLR